MKTTNKIAIAFAFIWIIIKLIVFNIGLSVEWFNVTAMINLLFLLVVIFVVLHFHKQGRQTEFLSDLKEAMKGGSIYTLLVAFFLLIYFSAIDTEFITNRMEELGAFTHAPEEVDFEALKAQDPVKMANMSRDDFIAKEKETRELFSSPFLSATIIFAGMMLVTFFYSLIATVFSRKVLNRLR